MSLRSRIVVGVANSENGTNVSRCSHLSVLHSIALKYLATPLRGRVAHKCLFPPHRSQQTHSFRSELIEGIRNIVLQRAKDELITERVKSAYNSIELDLDVIPIEQRVVLIRTGTRGTSVPVDRKVICAELRTNS